MFQLFSRFQASLSTFQWAAIAVFGLVFNLWATNALNSAYAASGFPVPYWEAQLSFDQLKLKGWYQDLLAHGGLAPYLHAQYVDFLFIASVLVLHVSVLVLVSRVHPVSSRGRKLLLLAAALSALAPVFDALENLVSFVMLAQPLTFAPSLAMLYSSLASGKFVVFTFAYVVAPAGLVWGCYSRLMEGRSKAGAA